ncbi:hypothetical protein K1719_033846 [Acacia pycnantha]|nr:hypothetical protein K1719_033846 [Acacia pycnantha]
MRTGQRRFLASTYTEFWRRYKNMDSKLRHHYEVIKEGLPCHLYFDLEFNKRVNPGKDEDEMVDLLISVILEALNEKYFICGDPEWTVELDSSTDDMWKELQPRQKEADKLPPQHDVHHLAFVGVFGIVFSISKNYF